MLPFRCVKFLHIYTIFRWKPGKSKILILLYPLPVVGVAVAGFTVVDGIGVLEVTDVVSWIDVVDPGVVVIAVVDFVVASGVVVGSPVVVGSIVVIVETVSVVGSAYVSLGKGLRVCLRMTNQ